jgi:hypothetical protein
MNTTRTKCLFCGVGLLAGMMAIPAAEAASSSVPVRTLTHRVVDNQPAAVQTVGYRIGGRSRYGYGYRSRGGLSVSIGYSPRYYGYRSYSSSYRAPYYGHSYYRPRYSSYSYYRAPYYGYSYYRPRYYSYSYYRPVYYGSRYSGGSYYYGRSVPYVVPTYGGVRYHGSYGYGSACCN